MLGTKVVANLKNELYFWKITLTLTLYPNRYSCSSYPIFYNVKLQTIPDSTLFRLCKSDAQTESYGWFKKMRFIYLVLIADFARVECLCHPTVYTFWFPVADYALNFADFVPNFADFVPNNWLHTGLAESGSVYNLYNHLNAVLHRHNFFWIVVKT